MTARAGTSQPTRANRPGRIIERPRLIKLLDEAEAPVILIVAPAGYGKTTLARQWARTLTGVIWVSCTPSHRDVVTFSEDVAAGIDALGGDASRFVGEYVRARSNPQRAAREIAVVLAKKLDEAPAHWLVIDDYQELADSPEAEELILALRDRVRARILVLSRAAPSWITTRSVIYNNVAEIGSSELALTEDEVRRVLGQRPELDQIVRLARGWPAVIALAAGLPGNATSEPVEPTLHRYVAEELFATAGPGLQEELIDLALLPDLSAETIRERFGESAERVISDALNLGFLSVESTPALHPLLREFLLTKLEGKSHEARIRRAVQTAVESTAWNLALDLVLRFGLTDLIDPVLQRAFKPLVRAGRLETLRRFAARIKSTSEFPPPAVDVIDAEVALREGNFELAASIAERAHSRLARGHELRCRSALLAGRAYLVVADQSSAIAYRDAAEEARDGPDRIEATFGLASTQVFTEKGDATPAVEELRRLRHRHPTNLVRYATADLNLRRFTGFGGEIPLPEALQALPLTPDPHVRTAFTYTSGYLLGVRGEYRRAKQLLQLLEHDVNEFDLDFVRPFAEWMRALVSLGQRRFGEADRWLQSVEDSAAKQHHKNHGFNAQMLRARLLLQTGDAVGALELLQASGEVETVFPSWQGEYLATRALALACQGMSEDAAEFADRATRTSRFVEVRVLAHAARAVSAAIERSGFQAIASLFVDATRFCVWDPVICALRASNALCDIVRDDRTLRLTVRPVVQRAEDGALARHLQLRTRTYHTPGSVLSPREFEVLGLMAHGLRNKEIARALFVAESTIKVHVHHIFEKLGVRSRSAAVARYERTRDRYAD